MTAQPTDTPPALPHNLRHNKVLHKRVVVLTVATAQIPHVPDEERLSIQPIGHDMFNVRVQCGLMEDPNVPEVLEQAREQRLELHADDVTYFFGRETIVVMRPEGVPNWRQKLFVLIARNAVRATAFFPLTTRARRTIVQVEM